MHEDAVAELSLAQRYEGVLRDALGVSEEAALTAAYDFGRTLLGMGLGVLDLAAVHARVVSRVLAECPAAEASRVIDRSSRLFVESLVPFEMTLRGCRDAHTALRASEVRYRDLFENANDTIFTTDLDGRLTSINRAGETMTGYSREALLAMHVEDLIAPEYVHHVLRLRSGEQCGGEDRLPLESEVIARDGRRIPLEVSTRIMADRSGAIGLQGIARDITDRRMAESALRHLNERLEEKVRHIAHALHDEAGQLLASVYLSVAEIADELPQADRRRIDDLRTLLDQVDDQLRRLAHELRPTILDDLGLLPACEFLAEGVSKRSQLPVIVRGTTGGRLPPAVETALYRIAQEALTNAVKHAHPSLVTVEFRRDASLLTGRIRDNGVGFDVPEVLHRTNMRGLGLIGMRERLVAVGGRLSITSQPGQGTSVEFEIPVEA